MAETKRHSGFMFLGTNAERIAYTTTGLREGVQWVESDTNAVYIWNGSIWVGAGGGSSVLGIVAKAADYTATVSDYTILVTCSIADIIITLPAAANNTGRVYNIKKMDATAWTVIVDGNAGELIDGAATATLTVQYEAITIQCDGTGWWVL